MKVELVLISFGYWEARYEYFWVSQFGNFSDLTYTTKINSLVFHFFEIKSRLKQVNSTLMWHCSKDNKLGESEQKELNNFLFISFVYK